MKHEVIMALTGVKPDVPARPTQIQRISDAATVSRANANQVKPKGRVWKNFCCSSTARWQSSRMSAPEPRGVPPSRSSSMPIANTVPKHNRSGRYIDQKYTDMKAYIGVIWESPGMNVGVIA